MTTRDSGRRRGRKVRRALVALVGSAALLGGALSLAWVVPMPERLAAPPSTVMTFDDGSVAHVFLSPDDRYRIRVDLEDVDPAYIEALLRFEDRRFFTHPGVDALAVWRAVWLNLRHQEVVSGASTLTMQLVRLVEPRPRTLRSKAIEALRAVQLELRMSKEEVLEAYLQFAPYGGNVEGVEAAALAYFGHRADALSADEVCVLLAVPQDPSGRHPTPDHESALRGARDSIAARLLDAGALPLGEGAGRTTPDEVLAAVKRAKVPAGTRPFPRHAPHAARWLFERHEGGDRIETTLDAGSQRVAEAQLVAYREALARDGIHNGSVVVVDHASGAVRALVGNFDFFDEDRGGQIPGFAQPRSPGSALKPFVYAFGVDRGLTLPEALVPDIPVDYSGYAPDNYDGGFEGLVTLEEALSRSLNVPFVNLLRDVGVERFVGTLRVMGADHFSELPGHYGLSAAVGAAEVTPLEMAGLYTTLAQDGRLTPLYWLRGDAPGERVGEGTRMFAPGAAWLTRRALARKDRPDFPSRRRLTGAPAAIHWKTGTSYGHRDAWAVGSDALHTVAVWLGNFDNASAAALVGAEAAGPVLFDVLEGLADTSGAPFEDRRPRDLSRVELCAYSGRLPTSACEHTRPAWALTERVPTAPCPYHVSVDVDLETGLAVGPSCRGGRDFETRTFVTWPASIRRWLGERHRWLPRPPSPADGCVVSGAVRPPRILSPPAGQVALLRPGVDRTDQEIPLAADARGDATRLSWFVDGEYLGSAAAHERLWWTPVPGVHELLVMDERGASSSRRLEVRAWR